MQAQNNEVDMNLFKGLFAVAPGDGSCRYGGGGGGGVHTILVRHFGNLTFPDGQPPQFSESW